MPCSCGSQGNQDPLTTGFLGGRFHEAPAWGPAENVSKSPGFPPTVGRPRRRADVDMRSSCLPQSNHGRMGAAKASACLLLRQRPQLAGTHFDWQPRNILPYRLLGRLLSVAQDLLDYRAKASQNVDSFLPAPLRSSMTDSRTDSARNTIHQHLLRLSALGAPSSTCPPPTTYQRRAQCMNRIAMPSDPRSDSLATHEHHLQHSQCLAAPPLVYLRQQWSTRSLGSRPAMKTVSPATAALPPEVLDASKLPPQIDCLQWRHQNQPKEHQCSR
mmetsp:Transcript_62443/g.167180  ORF Transcript_62443/g.167180 Transcript_62443/m.167180 type:complete len:272 (+) Transcript_62443:738-1553(+)